MSYDIYLFRPDPNEADVEQACWDLFDQKVKPRASANWTMEITEITSQLNAVELRIQEHLLDNGVELIDLDAAITIHLWNDGHASAEIPYWPEFEAREKKLRKYLDVFEAHGFRVLDPQLGMVIKPGLDLSELRPDSAEG